MASPAIESFLSTVDPAKTTVIAFPEYIAIFGGDITKKGSRAKPKSQRDAFVRWLRQYRTDLENVLLLPENYDDWNDFNTYSDLLLFEKDLGVLTSAVLVFVEAPGAIAELGAFSQIDTLSQRLVIVATQDRHPKKSFISLGPIRSVEVTQKFPSGICVIPNLKPADLAPHMPVVMQVLDKKRRRKNATAAFDKNDPQHEILLILDFINMFSVATVSELQKLSRHFGLALDKKRLNQVLFVLEKTQLVFRQRYGNNHYFVPKRFRKAYVDFTARAGADSFSREGFKTERWKEIQADQHRRSAFDLANKEGV